MEQTMHIRYREKPFGFEKPAPVKGELVIIEDRCKGCGFCVEYCPNEVLKVSDKYNSKGYHPPEVINENDCRYCGFCQMICPDFAIFAVEVKEEPEGEVVSIES
jgi:2-oxoglutarate ferredoxin oxidoreductase subunit delta